jgi:hypothetical protein
MKMSKINEHLVRRIIERNWDNKVNFFDRIEVVMNASCELIIIAEYDKNHQNFIKMDDYLNEIQLNRNEKIEKIL